MTSAAASAGCPSAPRSNSPRWLICQPDKALVSKFPNRCPSGVAALAGIASSNAQDCTKTRRKLRSRRVRVVLDRDDLAVPQFEYVRPVVAVVLVIRPREGDYGAAPACVDRVDPRVVISSLPTPVQRGCENLTGLVGAVSRGWWLPEPREPASSAPLHLRMDQRDQRFHVAARQCLVAGTNGVGAHFKAT
jgi:hypothetical protein